MAVKPTASGLGAWLVQRVTAVYMLIFVLATAGFLLLHPRHSFAQWSGWIGQPLVSAAIVVFFASLLSHLWVGLRDVLIDYARPAGLRRVLLAAMTLAVAGMALWVSQILFWR